MNRARIIAIVCMLTSLLILYIVQIQVTSNLSTLDDRYALLQAQVDQLTKSNEQIKDEVLSESSLTMISSKAAAIGFIPGTRVLYIEK